MTYSKTSLYYETRISADGSYLDQYVIRNVPATAEDVVYEIAYKYNLRPDLLAYDLYGNSNLWWVFAERNPNTLKDPVGDFRAGILISLPNKQTLISSLGL